MPDDLVVISILIIRALFGLVFQESRVFIFIEFQITNLLPIIIYVEKAACLTFVHTSHRINLVLGVGDSRIDLRPLRLTIFEELGSNLREESI